jgi:hypothetical protein
MPLIALISSFLLDYSFSSSFWFCYVIVKDLGIFIWKILFNLNLWEIYKMQKQMIYFLKFYIYKIKMMMKKSFNYDH